MWWSIIVVSCGFAALSIHVIYTRQKLVRFIESLFLILQQLYLSYRPVVPEALEADADVSKLLSDVLKPDGSTSDKFLEKVIQQLLDANAVSNASGKTGT